MTRANPEPTESIEGIPYDHNYNTKIVLAGILISAVILLNYVVLWLWGKGW